MPELEITIGGRRFDVACQPGEEHFLEAAARLLDTEARVLSDQIGRMPEARMLLMAGLLLADKTAGVEDKLREAEARIAELEGQLRELESRPAQTERVEVPVIPARVTEMLMRLAEQTEKLADSVEREEAEADRAPAAPSGTEAPAAG